MYTFKKAEKLNSKVLIEKLFENGRSFTTHPFRVTWLSCSINTGFPAQIGFAVPKKNFKRAVDRNKLKRVGREAYRKHKQKLYTYLTEQNKSIIIMLIYTAKEQTKYNVVESKINTIIDRLIKETSNELD